MQREGSRELCATAGLDVLRGIIDTAGAEPVQLLRKGGGEVGGPGLSYIHPLPANFWPEKYDPLFSAIQNSFLVER